MRGFDNQLSDRRLALGSLRATRPLTAQHLAEPLYSAPQLGTGSVGTCPSQSGTLQSPNSQLTLPTTGSSASANVSSYSQVAGEIREKNPTLENISSENSVNHSSKIHHSSAKPSLLRALLKKKSKGKKDWLRYLFGEKSLKMNQVQEKTFEQGNQPPTEGSSTYASDQRDLDANFSSFDLMMKRCASPTLPEGATQPKSEPPACNGEPNLNGHNEFVRRRIGFCDSGLLSCVKYKERKGFFAECIEGKARRGRALALCSLSILM
ncbi:unnamed protein product [Enterobius vermicularis]|uniref:Uncharacterized protein n=1 Tax=Enterobius vermicularis TaxID=51028 RepID=A0A158QBA3_ENTVE|nr:unnamed protein product [Enterobius vermicularis]